MLEYQESRDNKAINIYLQILSLSDLLYPLCRG